MEHQVIPIGKGGRVLHLASSLAGPCGYHWALLLTEERRVLGIRIRP